jgi:HEAT repeat protein
MLQSRGQSPLAISIAKARLEDADPTVRTLAAVILKDSQRLVSIATSAEQPAGVRRRAARALMQTGSEADKMEVAKSLATGPAPLHSLAFELSASLGGAAEPVLIQLVGSSNQDVARDAAGRLAKTGSIKAIPALREFQERTGALDGVAVKKELAAAIKSIRPKARSGDDDETRVLVPSHQPTLQDHESPTNWRGVPVVGDAGENPGRSGERRTPGSRTVRRRG